MVRVDTNTLTVSNLYTRITDHNAFGSDQSIEITSDFQRGDEETGVWSLKDKQNYIDSLMRQFPTGIFTLVKDHETAVSFKDPWKVLDGGNRLRAIRDYKDDLFQNKKGVKYSELSPQDSANFNTILIPCQWQTIQRDDPPNTIAEMFCRLNTSAKPLSQGELIKAHGWKKNCWEIEMSKKLVGDVWDTNIQDDELSSIRSKWCNLFGPIQETKRCDNLAVSLGYVMSAKMNNFDMFDKRYRKHERHLAETTAPTDDEKKAIYAKLNTFLDIMYEIFPNDIFGRLTKGIPSQAKIAPIWKPICEDTLTPKFRGKMVRFYKVHSQTDIEVKTNYIRILTQGGNSETTKSKIDAVHEYINEFD